MQPLSLSLPSVNRGAGGDFCRFDRNGYECLAVSLLDSEVATIRGRFLTKGLGGDPITKRFYSKNAVVVTRQSGATETHPFVEVPLLFVVNTDELRKDDASRENVVKVAQILKELSAQKATFAIEGHASAEGNAARNRELSDLRALRIQELLRVQGVPAEAPTRNLPPMPANSSSSQGVRS